MSAIVLFIGVVLAAAILVLAFRVQGRTIKGIGALAALAVLLVCFTLASIRYVSSNEVGVIYKNVGFKTLKGGAYLAVNGETGVQADVLTPGWHLWYWPVFYSVKSEPLTEVPSGQVGILQAADGKPLPEGQVIAPEWLNADVSKMLDAKHFLTTGGGCKGTQATVLTTGKYRLNTELFKVKMSPITEVVQGEVAVLKANFGKPPTLASAGPGGGGGGGGAAGEGAESLRLAAAGEMGIRAEVMPPGKYPINTDAYTVTEIWTTQMVLQFMATQGQTGSRQSEDVQQQSVRAGKSQDQQAQLRSLHEATPAEGAITVRTSDGFTFPVDVRVEYVVEPKHAPIVVSRLGDDEGERFRNVMVSAVRAIFRNNAESVKALDYVQQRSHQESQSLTMLKEQLARYGVTVTAVRIGNVGDEQTLGQLLKTQTDREIAKQELITFGEQQKAAEQQKTLTKAKQESEEERKLATAAYAAKIAEEAKKQKITEATAEAESIRIKAEAQAKAYQSIALQIGKTNAAVIEMLKIVGERNIQITPRVMINNGAGRSGSAAAGADESTALIGTMLDTMISREEEPARAKP